MCLYYLLLLTERFHDYPRLGGELFSLAFVPMTSVKLVGLAAFAGAVAVPRPSAAARQGPGAVVPLFVAFAAWSLFGTVVLRLNVPRVSVSYFLSLGILMLVTRRLVCTAKRIRGTLRMVVMAGGLASLWCYKQYLFDGALRAWGVGLDPNYEALALVVAIPLAAWMGWSEEGKGLRFVGKSCAASLVGATFLTQSRGALITLAMVGCLGLRRTRRKVTAAATTLGVAALLMVLAPSSLWPRFESIRVTGPALNGDETSVEARLAVLVAGVRMDSAHPVFGVGLDRFKALSIDYNPRLRALSAGFVAHDTYVQVAAEAGLPALLLFIAVMVAGFANCRAARRLAQDRTLSGIADAMRLALMAYAVGALFLSAQYLMWYWLLIFLSHNLCEIARDNLRRSVVLTRTAAGKAGSAVGYA